MHKIFFFFLLFAFAVNSAHACEFKFSVLGLQKEIYRAGDTLTIHIEYQLIHRACKLAPKETKFKFDGIQIIGATEWKEVGAGVFSRDVKAKVSDDQKDKITLAATRTCNKKGGYGVFTLAKKH
ncbi:MAG TPA: hypothetical protein VLM37_02490 [Fibrobacteraceae bacterium]|nr:hypothetical protein [Fibrobacteraceae bacterium]